MPALTDTRFAYLRYTTKQFIYEDPTTIVLKRQVATEKPGGGHDYPKVPLPPQVFRLMNQATSSGIEHGADEGTARKFDYILVGEHNADIDINDTWEEAGDQYKVEALMPGNNFEIRALVTGYSKEPEHG